MVAERCGHSSPPSRRASNQSSSTISIEVATVLASANPACCSG
jgi:hypothetical protein